MDVKLIIGRRSFGCAQGASVCLIETVDWINIVGDVDNGKEVIDLIDKGISADIVLLQLGLYESCRTELINSLKSNSPNTKVIISSNFDKMQDAIDAYSTGVWGLLKKTIGLQELLFALHQVQNGNRYVCSALSVALLEAEIVKRGNYSKLTIELTDREAEVLTLISHGLTNEEMAEELFLSKRTIEGHRGSLIDKTSTRNTAALINFAVKNGLIS